jgi:hypothetical protein
LQIQKKSLNYLIKRGIWDKQSLSMEPPFKSIVEYVPTQSVENDSLIREFRQLRILRVEAVIEGERFGRCALVGVQETGLAALCLNHALRAQAALPPIERPHPHCHAYFVAHVGDLFSRKFALSVCVCSW